MFQLLNFKVKIAVFAILLLVLLFTVKPALAIQVANLHEVDILVVDESVSVRRAAFSQGLDEVFIRLSGDSGIMGKITRPAASRYVKKYSYDPVEIPTVNAQDELLSYRLTVQFNLRLVEQYLQQNGIAVWGEHRPEVVIWFAVRDGANEYVLKQGDVSLLKSAVDEVMFRRGIPVRWPLFDSKDQNILSIVDIRGGFDGSIMQASKRYSEGPVITANLLWNGGQWQSSWALLMHNEQLQAENRHWNMAGEDYNLLINNAIEQIGDALGKVFAIDDSAGEQQWVTLHLDLQGINSIEKYSHVEHYLNALNAVKTAKPLRVDGQSVVFDVTLRSSKNSFLNLIRNDSVLQQVESRVMTESLASDDRPPLSSQGFDAAGTLATSGQGEQTKPVPVYYFRLR